MQCQLRREGGNETEQLDLWELLRPLYLSDRNIRGWSHSPHYYATLIARHAKRQKY